PGSGLAAAPQARSASDGTAVVVPSLALRACVIPRLRVGLVCSLACASGWCGPVAGAPGLCDPSLARRVGVGWRLLLRTQAKGDILTCNLGAGAALWVSPFAEGSMNLRHDRLTKLTTAIFQAAGCTAEEAERIAVHLVEANLVGHDSHGVIRVATYVQW